MFLKGLTSMSFNRGWLEGPLSRGVGAMREGEKISFKQSGNVKFLRTVLREFCPTRICVGREGYIFRGFRNLFYIPCQVVLAVGTPIWRTSSVGN